MKILPLLSPVILASYQSQEHRMLRKYQNHRGLRRTKEKGGPEVCGILCEKLQEDSSEGNSSCMDCIQDMEAIWESSISCAHNATAVILETCLDAYKDDLLTQKFIMACAEQQSQIGCKKDLSIAIASGVLLGVCALVIVVCLASRWVDQRRRHFDHGPVARKAGLPDLRLSERNLVLQHIFQKTAFTYCSEENNGVQKNVDQKAVDLQESEVEMRELTQGVPSGKRDERESKVLSPEGESRIEDYAHITNHDVTQEVDHEQVCCICLCTYENGCMLMTGTQCSHIFHYDCCMEWLQKHDHCPYCRKEMMSPSEMQAAAIHVLGQARITEKRSAVRATE